jgi:hypothetical protein
MYPTAAPPIAVAATTDRDLIRSRSTVAAAHNRKVVVPAARGYGGRLSPWSRSVRSLSFGGVCCRNSSAVVFSAVVNGPVGGRRTPRTRSRRTRKRFMQGAYRAPGRGVEAAPAFFLRVGVRWPTGVAVARYGSSPSKLLVANRDCVGLSEALAAVRAMRCSSSYPERLPPPQPDLNRQSMACRPGGTSLGTLG